MEFKEFQNCPKCRADGKWWLQKTFKKAFLGKPDRITYRCEQCGHKFTTLANEA